MQVLEDLALDFPLLGSLVEQRAGGQKRLPLGVAGARSDGAGFIAASITAAAESEAVERPPSATAVESASTTDSPASVSEAIESYGQTHGAVQLPSKSATAGRPTTAWIFNSPTVPMTWNSAA